MAEKRGLGRGLSALLGEVDEAPAAGPAAPPPVNGGIREIPIEFLVRNEDQPRYIFPEAQLEELANSIRDKGVLQPILVRPDGTNRFQIVAGERRWRAAQKAGLRAVPAMVRELNDLQVLEIGVIENVQRADLSAIEEANAYKQLMERFGRTQEAVAEAVGKSRSHVANTLRLLQLPKGVQEHLLAGRLTPGHARAIATAPDADALADRIVDRGLSVREAEAMARKGAAPASKSGGTSGPGKSSRGASGSKDADTLALENDLSEALGLDVFVADEGGSGELRIQYATLEQLDDLCRRLTRAG
jgi:ParB family transcriptional regulator, chromosome partitioning protein